MSSLVTAVSAQTVRQPIQETQEQPIPNASGNLRSVSSGPRTSYLSQAASKIAENSTTIALGILTIYAASNMPTADANCASCMANCFASGGTHYQCAGVCFPECAFDAISLISTMFGGK